MSGRIVICCLLALVPQVGLGQYSSYSKVAAAFENSEKQWMVSQIYTPLANTNCRELQQTLSRKLEDSLLIFNDRLTVNAQHRGQILDLFFGDNSCERCTKLLSLCDLYFPLIDKKLQAAKLHRDYRYLPLLISGLNQSYTEAGDRSGLWGISYLLAKKMHLQINEDIDERKSGDLATDAAVKYLAELHAMFAGNDRLTLSAFLNGVPVAKYSQDNFQPPHKNENYAQVETLELLAALKLWVENARTDNKLQRYFDLFEEFEPIRFRQEVSFAALEAVLQTPLPVVRSLNPTYIGDRIPTAYSRVSFLLDKASVAKLATHEQELYNWSAVPDAQESGAIDSSRYFLMHRVKRGETLSSICSKYHVKPKAVREINNLRSDHLAIGVILKIPNEIHPPVNEAMLPKENVEEKKIESTKTYVVKRGDSLWKIAQKYQGVSEQDIKRWNNISDKLRPGQKLIIRSDK